jgi:O-antigen/teichoic acid export membrane protein
MGVDTILIREISRRPAQASYLVGGALSLRIGLSAGTMILAPAIILLITDDYRVIGLVTLYSATFLFSFGTLYGILFNVELRSHVPNLAHGVWSVVYSLIRIGLVALGARVAHFLAADVVSGAVGVVMSRWVARRHSSLRPRIRLDLRLWRVLLSEGWPIAATGLLIGLHSRIDQLLLFRWSGAGELGIYAVAVRASEIWVALASALITSVFPLLSRDATQNDRRIERTAHLVYRCLYILFCPVALLLIIYSRPLLGLVFGPTFVEGANALRLLAVAEVFVFSNAATYNLLFSSNYQREAMLIAGLSLIVNASLNVWLIPVSGSVGAAVASLASYSAVPIMTLLLPRVRWMGSLALLTLTRPVAATGLAAIVLWTFNPGMIAGLALTALVYPMTLMVVGALNRADLKLVAKAWSGT